MKIICFSSHTAIWSYAFPEAIIAHELQKKGHEVLYITPGNEFGDRSNPVNESILRKEFDLNGYEISQVLTSKDRNSIKKLVNTLTQNNFEKLILDGVNIGKLALYETLLFHKKTSAHFSRKEWKKCVSEIECTLTSFFACKNILKREKPDRILMFNTLYSVNHVWERYASKRNIPVYFLANGPNLFDANDTLVIGKYNTIYYMNCMKKFWGMYKNISVTPDMLRYTTKHFIETLKAKNALVYSVPISDKKLNIKKIFGIGKKQKILTATMSSYDEMFAADYIGVWEHTKTTVFSSQEQWIKEVINFLKSRKDLFLIIRVHPREFPNKRYPLRSEHIKILKKIFTYLPKNVKVNWPTDNISIYDLAQETNVFLNAWSTVGVEMSLLGIPVVSYSEDLILYPSDLNYVAINTNDYFKKINFALKEGWTYEKIKFTNRWLALLYYLPIIRLRNKREKIEGSDDTNNFLGNVRRCFDCLPQFLKLLIVKLFLAAPGLVVGKRRKEDCISYTTNPINISDVEEMIVKSKDTILDVRERMFKNATSSHVENKYLNLEIKRIYKVMYGNLFQNIIISKNSLQYNLKKVFT